MLCRPAMPCILVALQIVEDPEWSSCYTIRLTSAASNSEGAARALDDAAGCTAARKPPRMNRISKGGLNLGDKALNEHEWELRVADSSTQLLCRDTCVSCSRSLQAWLRPCLRSGMVRNCVPGGMVCSARRQFSYIVVCVSTSDSLTDSQR